MKLTTALKDYLTEIEIRHYTPKTIRGCRNNLNLFLRFCEDIEGIRDAEELTPALVRSFTKYMTERGRKGTYINGLLRTVKTFTQHCYDNDLGGFNTKHNFKWCKQEKPVIMTFKPQHVQMMLRDCRGNSFMDVRDRTILTMLFETGIRCYELCCVRQEDIHADFVVINGKNHKQRVVPITPVFRKAMLRYEDVRSNYFALKDVEDIYFLFFHGKQLTNSAVEHETLPQSAHRSVHRILPAAWD